MNHDNVIQMLKDHLPGLYAKIDRMENSPMRHGVKANGKRTFDETIEATTDLIAEYKHAIELLSN